jgi:outer membrane immunogenic protein
MKKIMLGAIALLAIGAAPALAADLPARTYTKAPVVVPPAVYSWTGFYVGASVGGHAGHGSDPAVFGFNTWFGPPDNTTAANAWPNTLKPSGFAGGGQVGYNWQVSNFVFGAEADIVGLTGTASRNIAFPINFGSQSSFVGDSAKDNWMATLRARGGLAFDRLLLYVTGGAAFSNWSIGHSYSDQAGATPTNVSTSTTRSGWTVGGGLEYAITNNWTVRGQYLYANFGTFNNTLTMTSGVIGFSVVHPEKLTENLGLVAINYKF